MINTDTNVTVKPNVDPSYYLKEYDDVLMGRRKTYSSALMAKEQGSRTCEELLRAIFELYLHWTPEEVRDKLTPDVVKTLKIHPLITRLPCPPELNPKTDLYYVAWYLYPETRNASDADLILKLYTDLMDGAIKKFPGGYFDGNDGYLRARILFMTMVREYMPPFQNIESMYAYFASPDGKRCLSKYKLIIPLRELYGSPLAYLHDALPWSQKDEDLYEKYSALSPAARNDGSYLPVTEAERDHLFGLDISADDKSEVSDIRINGENGGLMVCTFSEDDEEYVEDIPVFASELPETDCEVDEEVIGDIVI